MRKTSETSPLSARRTHRTYTAQFKAQLVAACQQPGASIAALALQHGMNANVLHRWLKEHQHSGRHHLSSRELRAIAAPATPSPAFIPLTLPAGDPVPGLQDIRIELHNGPLTMTLTWPATAADQLASWSAAILK